MQLRGEAIKNGGGQFRGRGGSLARAEGQEQAAPRRAVSLLRGLGFQPAGAAGSEVLIDQTGDGGVDARAHDAQLLGAGAGTGHVVPLLRWVTGEAVLTAES